MLWICARFLLGKPQDPIRSDVRQHVARPADRWGYCLWSRRRLHLRRTSSLCSFPAAGELEFLRPAQLPAGTSVRRSVRQRLDQSLDLEIIESGVTLLDSSGRAGKPTSHQVGFHFSGRRCLLLEGALLVERSLPGGALQAQSNCNRVRLASVALDAPT